MTLSEAAKTILDGGLVVFPTETVYGLGALASNDEAVQRIFEAKGRPQHNPLILHIADVEQLKGLVQPIPDAAQRLIEAFWPGPLTICFQKAEQVSDLVTAGLPTVCIRQPKHPVAHAFLKEIGEAVAAPSANKSGRPSTTRQKDATLQFEGESIAFLDGDDSEIGLESTVVDCSADTVSLLRPGSIGIEALEKVLGTKVSPLQDPSQPTSPGQLLAHYAPSGKLTVVVGEPAPRRQWIQEQREQDTVLGLIGPSEELNETLHQHLSKSEEDLGSYARYLYQFLNWCDRQGAAHILLEFPSIENDLSKTLLDRLEKASGGNIVFL